MPSTRRFIRLFRLIFFSAFTLIALNAAHAQTTLDIVVFRSPDSLTIYIPGTIPVNLTGLTIEATTVTGRNIRQELGTLPAFIGLPYQTLPTPICFHITRSTADPLPLECQTITRLTQTLVAANIFWYEAGTGDRVLIFYLGSGVQICPSGISRCDLRFAIPPTPTATNTPIFTPTPSQTPTLTITPTPEIPVGFTPVTSNDQWEVVTQDFDGIPMVLVPTGCFMMGSTDEQLQTAVDLGADIDLIRDEQPNHEQCFDEPFWIDQTEVTQADFERLNGEKDNDNEFNGDQRPVENITWFEARDFCELRGIRLPTEREWEYAARGPDNLIFPWGNRWDPNLIVWNTNQPANVGNIPEGQSWVGALDMSGNIWEWVSTTYGVDVDFDFNFNESSERFYRYPYALDEREQDSTNRAYIRVLRGDSWDENLRSNLRTSIRAGNSPDAWNEYYGFRCAADYTAAP